jgi:uncharacterized protein
MFIAIKELELHSVPFRVDVPTGEIDYGNQLVQASGLHAEGVAKLTSASLGEIQVRGKLTVKIDAPCDRCLETATVDIDKQFDLIYAPLDGSPDGGEDEIEEAAIEVGFYEGNGLKLNDVLREVVLLALPMQLICSDTCKGICPECGQNRNQVDCGCRPASLDDRWSKLKQFRPQPGLSH